MPPPPSSSEPRGRSPPHGSAPPAHGSAPGVAGVWFAVSGAADWFVVSAAGVALFDGVVFCGFLLPQAGAPSIAPANTTVRQIVWVVSHFMGRERITTSVRVPYQRAALLTCAFSARIRRTSSATIASDISGRSLITRLNPSPGTRSVRVRSSAWTLAERGS